MSDFTRALDRYLTSEPDDGRYNQWCEELEEDLNDQDSTFFDQVGDYLTDHWKVIDYLWRKGYSTLRAARAILKIIK